MSGVPDLGLNSEMTGFQGLFDQGRLAIINGVSVPEDATGTFDHEASQYTYQTCDTRNGLSAESDGWLGRYLDTVAPGPVTAGVDFGFCEPMLTGRTTTPIRLKSVNSFKLQVKDFDVDERREAYEQIGFDE